MADTRKKQTSSKSRKKQSPAESDPLKAYIVSGKGTEEEIALRCSESIPGWKDKSARVKADTVRLMRLFESLPKTPDLEVRTDEQGNGVIHPAAEDNVTLTVLRTVETFASSSQDLTNDRLEQIYFYLRRTKDRAPTTQELQAAIAFIRGANATDPVQSSLALQMHATHDAAIRALGRMETAQFVEQSKMFGNLGAKLLNAYTRQAETLAKLQRGGEQVIKHVHIDNRGGQAVVTEKVVAGGRNDKVAEQPHEQGACSAALLGQDPQGNGLPISGDQGKEAVQDSWGSVAGRA